MTTVYNSEAHGGPTHVDHDLTHAFIVGVGRYGRQVTGTRSPKAPAIPPAARSALAVATWLIRHRARLCTTLGSLELLVSDPDQPAGAEFIDPLGDEHRVDDPTIEAMRQAFERWIDRLDLRTGNTALFYAAGHGVFDDQPYLLAEDYGAAKRVAFKEIVALQDFYTGMSTCKAGHQMFIADCCQEVNDDLLRQITETRGEAFVSVAADEIRVSERAMIYSAPMGTLAAADESGMSHFTRALIEALNGEGARRGRDRLWHVSYQSLYDAIPILAERQGGEKLRMRGEPELSGPLKIVTLEEPPRVEVELCTTPEEALMDADLTIYDPNGAQCWCESRPMQASIQQRLTAQNGYRACAEFGGTAYEDAEERFDVEPLMYPVPIPVSPAPGRRGLS